MNENAMAWLRMAFPLLKHQHKSNASCTAQYPQGVAHEGISCLRVGVIPAKEMAAKVLKTELNTITMKETDNPQSIDDMSNKLSHLYMASGSMLTAAMEKSQQINIMPSLYSGCINKAS